MTIGGVRIESAAVHVTVARRLVHLLKYQGLDTAGRALATMMVDRMPGDAGAIVPVPRAMLRRWKYGVDPAWTLATHLGEHTGVPVVSCLAADVWWPAHAGSRRAQRRKPSLRLVREVPAGSVLVDDVLTTGATLVAAARLAGVGRAVTATRADSGRLE